MLLNPSHGAIVLPVVTKAQSQVHYAEAADGSYIYCPYAGEKMRVSQMSSALVMPEEKNDIPRLHSISQRGVFLPHKGRTGWQNTLPHYLKY